MRGRKILHSTYVQYAILHLWEYICTVCHTTLMGVHMYSMPYYTYGSTYVQYAIPHLWEYICTVCHTTLMVVHMYSMPYYTYGIHNNCYTSLAFFRSGNIFGRHSLSGNVLLEYCSTTRVFLHRSIFSYEYLERECKHVV